MKVVCAEDIVTPYAMTVSGGISLGNYEAGMNWAIIEIFRKERDRKNGANHGELISVTGASAGSINALLSAIRYCEAKDFIEPDVTYNLFHRTWSKVGFDSLLPDEEFYDPNLSLKGMHEKGGKLTDGILSRHPFMDVIASIKDSVINGEFEEGCRIRIGMSLTREDAIKTSIANVDVLAQRFFVPLELNVVDGRPVFRNYTNIHHKKDNHGNIDYGNIVYLPEDAKAGISIDRVIGAALASSAFPVFFGRVKLDICEEGDNKGSLICPEGFHKSSAVFVDGGVFDNIPLGATRMLTEDEKDESGKLKPPHYKRPFNYIYMSPSNTRGSRIDDASCENVETKSTLRYGIIDQLGFLDDTINIGMGNELYSTLRSYDWNNVDINELDVSERYKRSSKNYPRRLLLTSRGTPITAEYLWHFGAFASKDFREYDYYAGVYDGIYNAAKLLCSGSSGREKCIGKNMRVIHSELGLNEDEDAEYMFAMLYRKDICTNDSSAERCNGPVLDVKNRFYVLNKAMKKSACDSLSESAAGSFDKFDKFDTFLANLDASHTSLDLELDVFCDERLNALLRSGDYWYISYLQHMLDRMQKLEENADDSMLKMPIVASNYMINSVEVHDDDFIWANSSLPENASMWWYLLPDEVGFDVSQSGMVFGYRFHAGPLFAGIYPELDAGLHIVSDVTERNDFAHVAINARRRVPTTFGISSIGIGYGFYKEYGFSTQGGPEWTATNSNKRVNLNIGLLADKFRITYGKRIDGDSRARNNSVMIIISLTDVKGLVYWLFGKDAGL